MAPTSTALPRAAAWPPPCMPDRPSASARTPSFTEADSPPPQIPHDPEGARGLCRRRGVAGRVSCYHQHYPTWRRRSPQPCRSRFSCLCTGERRHAPKTLSTSRALAGAAFAPPPHPPKLGFLLEHPLAWCSGTSQTTPQGNSGDARSHQVREDEDGWHVERGQAGTRSIAPTPESPQTRNHGRARPRGLVRTPAHIYSFYTNAGGCNAVCLGAWQVSLPIIL